MENPSIKPFAYTYGFLMAGYSILVLVLMYVFGITEQNWYLGVINGIASIIIFVLGIKAFKKSNRGYLSLKEAIKVGLAIAAISGIITAIYTFIHYTFVYPEFIDMIKEQAYSDMADRGMTSEQIKQTSGMMDITTSPWFFATVTLISSLFFGFLISLIAGAIMKKQDPSLN